MNKELQILFKQDQADRRAFEQLDHEQIQQMLHSRNCLCDQVMPTM
jgi:hypothetical protein